MIMTETNIRIVGPGPELCIDTRCALVITAARSPDIPERVCNALRRRGLAAVYDSKKSEILVATRKPIPQLTLKENQWRAELKDTGEIRQLEFATSAHDASLLAQLVERDLLIKIERYTNLCTIDSPRIWYPPEPFPKINNIGVYRRFEVSGIPIESVGVGIAVHVSTAFFTLWTIADFFQSDIPEHEHKQRQELFETLSQRQRGKKATLLYNLNKSLHKCYFEAFPSGVTSATTKKFTLDGRTYKSLWEYYRQKYPYLKIAPNDPVAMVSFNDINRPKPVAAKLLRLRVMNDSLPKELKQADRISPDERCKRINKFWERLQNYPIGGSNFQVARHFWHVPEEKVIHLPPPELQFASGYTLPTPQSQSEAEYRDGYRQRLLLLRKVGCLEVPIAMERLVYFAIPSRATEEMRRRLIIDVREHLSKLTNKPIRSELVQYNNLDEVFAQLNVQKQPGVIVFVFENEAPETYYRVAHELKTWRVKRITYRNLKDKFTELQRAEKSRGNRNTSTPSKAEGDWYSFTEMTSLDVLQQMGCAPWSLEGAPYYDAHLAIDVGWDRRHFALSLLQTRPSFRLYTVVKSKIDIKQETINFVVLREEIVKLFQQAAESKYFQIPRSVLVLRDGRKCGDELEGINAAKEQLIEMKLLEKTAKVDVVDFHKSNKKGIRLWERTRANRAEQVLEGTALFLDKRTVVLANTGAATLRGGTADPVVLEAQSDHIDMTRVTKAVYASTHFNFSNPRVAQRLPLELKRTDDELKSQTSQEIRRVR